MLWEMLAGRPLFGVPDRFRHSETESSDDSELRSVEDEILGKPIPPVDQVRRVGAPLGADVTKLVARALERAPTERFQGLKELLRELKALPAGMLAANEMVAASVDRLARAVIDSRRAALETAIGARLVDSGPPPSRHITARPAPASRPAAVVVQQTVSSSPQTSGPAAEAFRVDEAPTLRRAQRRGAAESGSGGARVGPVAPRPAGAAKKPDPAPPFRGLAKNLGKTAIPGLGDEPTTRGLGGGVNVARLDDEPTTRGLGEAVTSSGLRRAMPPPPRARPAGTQPARIEAESVEPESVEPESIQPERVEPGALEPDSIRPQSILPVVGSKPTRSETDVTGQQPPQDEAAAVDQGLHELGARLGVDSGQTQPETSAQASPEQAASDGGPTVAADSYVASLVDEAGGGAPAVGVDLSSVEAQPQRWRGWKLALVGATALAVTVVIVLLIMRGREAAPVTEQLEPAAVKVDPARKEADKPVGPFKAGSATVAPSAPASFAAGSAVPEEMEATWPPTATEPATAPPAAANDRSRDLQVPGVAQPASPASSAGAVPRSSKAYRPSGI